MFTGFFYKLKEVRVPVSLREYLTLLEAVEKGLAGYFSIIWRALV